MKCPKCNSERDDNGGPCIACQYKRNNPDEWERIEREREKERPN